MLKTIALLGALLCACSPAMAGGYYDDIFAHRATVRPGSHHAAHWATRHFRDLPSRKTPDLGGMLAGVFAPLAAKARQIEAACGSRVISGVRHTFVAGTHRISEHASGHAVDMVGNAVCIYQQLTGWPGGYSTDYSAVHHVHISLGGREDGKRFAHNRHTRFAARHRHHRYS